MNDQKRDKKSLKEYNRNFFILLYPDNDEHVKALENIKTLYENYAYILHDKDTYEDCDDIKKSHWHVVIKFKNQRYRSAVSSELGLEERFVEGCALEKSLLYLIHFNDEDKFQYDINEVQGSLLPSLKKIIKSDGKDEGERVIDLMDYIDSTTTAIRTKDFARYCALNGYWDVYRRSALIFKDYIREHNNDFYIQASRLGWENLSDNEILECIAKCK